MHFLEVGTNTLFIVSPRPNTRWYARSTYLVTGKARIWSQRALHLPFVLGWPPDNRPESVFLLKGRRQEQHFWTFKVPFAVCHTWLWNSIQVHFWCATGRFFWQERKKRERKAKIEDMDEEKRSSSHTDPLLIRFLVNGERQVSFGRTG